jgi:hypothetical protein
VINDRTNGRPTSIPWSGDGWDVSFTRTSGDGYVFTCGTYTVSGQMAALGDQAPVRLKFWNYSAGPQYQHNFYVNNVRLFSAPPGPAQHVGGGGDRAARPRHRPRWHGGRLGVGQWLDRGGSTIHSAIRTATSG